MAGEDQIVAQVIAGDIGQFRKLVDQYRLPVFRFARNLIGDEHDAEDITQEVFLAAFHHLASYNSRRGSLLTWLMTITRNRCINYLKRTRPVVGGEAIAATQSPTHNNESARNEFWSHLDEALDSLPVEQKTVFILAEIEGLPYVDIARIEQTTLGTVKSRLHRAKRRLRAVVAPASGEQ